MFHLYEKVNNNEVYVIAEMSANHGGDLETALRIVREAKKAGADCLKIQTYTADSMTIDCDSDPFMIKGGLWDGYKLYDLYIEASTPYEWQAAIKEECEKVGIDFLSTPFDKAAVDFLENLGVEAYKIASFELVDIPLIEYVASKKKPVIISCGMGSLKEIKDAVDACIRQGNSQIVLLKCCSEYPSNWEDMHLGNIPDMQKRFNTLVGLSDHSFGSLGAVVGVSLGACVVEKHIKLDGIVSADSEFSMSIDEFAAMVRDIKAAKSISKGPTYVLSDSEEGSKVFRRSVFAVADIKKGETFTEENIRIIRPSFGLCPKYYGQILGRACAKDIKRGEPLSFENVSGMEADLSLDSMGGFELREATKEDMKLLFEWANDTSVRKNAFNTSEISLKEHEAWFESLMSDADRIQYIFMKSKEPIGQIRFSIKEDSATIDYSIACEKRGLGFGRIMLKLAMERFHKEHPLINILIGQVKPENSPSKSCFMQSGFKESFTQYEISIGE